MKESFSRLALLFGHNIPYALVLMSGFLELQSKGFLKTLYLLTRIQRLAPLIYVSPRFRLVLHLIHRQTLSSELCAQL